MLPHKGIPHYLALHIGFLALSCCCSSVLEFIFMAVCWQCPLTNILPSEKMGWLWGFFLSQGSLPLNWWTWKILRILSFRASECLLTSTVSLLTHFNFRPGYLKKKKKLLKCWMWQRERNSFHCSVSGKTGCFTSIYCSVTLSVKVTYLCAGITLDVYSWRNFSKWNLVIILFVRVLKIHKA